MVAGARRTERAAALRGRCARSDLGAPGRGRATGHLVAFRSRTLAGRRAATETALATIDELAGEEWTRDETAERMRAMYDYRRSRLAARAGETEDGDGYEHRSRKYQKMECRVLDAQRAELVRLRNSGVISNDVMHRRERELDLEDERLEI